MVIAAAAHHGYRSAEGKVGRDDGKPFAYVPKKTGVELYDLSADVAESENVAEKNPEVLARLKTLAEHMREELGDSLTQRVGKEVRPAGKLIETK